jgi:hypothetical protein
MKPRNVKEFCAFIRLSAQGAESCFSSITKFPYIFSFSSLLSSSRTGCFFFVLKKETKKSFFPPNFSPASWHAPLVGQIRRGNACQK